MENTLSFIFFFKDVFLFQLIAVLFCLFPRFFIIIIFKLKNPTNQTVCFGMNLMKEGQINPWINPADKAGEGEILIKQTWTF